MRRIEQVELDGAAVGVEVAPLVPASVVCLPMARDENWQPDYALAFRLAAAWLEAHPEARIVDVGWQHDSSFAHLLLTVRDKQ